MKKSSPVTAPLPRKILNESVLAPVMDDAADVARCLRLTSMLSLVGKFPRNLAYPEVSTRMLMFGGTANAAAVVFVGTSPANSAYEGGASGSKVGTVGLSS